MRLKFGKLQGNGDGNLVFGSLAGIGKAALHPSPRNTLGSQVLYGGQYENVVDQLSGTQPAPATFHAGVFNHQYVRLVPADQPGNLFEASAVPVSQAVAYLLHAPVDQLCGAFKDHKTEAFPGRINGQDAPYSKRMWVHQRLAPGAGSPEEMARRRTSLREVVRMGFAEISFSASNCAREMVFFSTF